MIAFTEPCPLAADEPCQCCQTDEPGSWEVEIAGDPEAVGGERWPHVVTCVLLVVAAVVFHLAALVTVPSPWAWVWFLFGASSCSLAGLVVGLAMTGIDRCDDQR